jgi:hypothetical protein
MIKDLAEKTQKLKDAVGEKTFNSSEMNLTGDTVLNGQHVSYWEEKQKEYDRQRLELIRN